jgi:hypothetical protein
MSWYEFPGIVCPCCERTDSTSVEPATMTGHCRDCTPEGVADRHRPVCVLEYDDGDFDLTADQAASVKADIATWRPATPGQQTIW